VIWRLFVSADQGPRLALPNRPISFLAGRATGNGATRIERSVKPLRRQVWAGPLCQSANLNSKGVSGGVRAWLWPGIAPKASDTWALRIRWPQI